MATGGEGEVSRERDLGKAVCGWMKMMMVMRGCSQVYSEVSISSQLNTLFFVAVSVAVHFLVSMMLMFLKSREKLSVCCSLCL